MRERVTYSEIRNRFLEIYFVGCRDHGFSGWSSELVTTWVYSPEFDGTYYLPIEQLMLEVVALVLTGGWYPTQVSFHRSEIMRLLSANKLESMIKEVPQDEAEEFLNDLKILKII
ncbi:hypothetical protein [Paraherbaspirillum soli]|uniref:Uncharacterized protein n=1 Tax=Paraherbaspirillum soli TaxID=631222 RepID=A0ABW0MGH5_9BURK